MGSPVGKNGKDKEYDDSFYESEFIDLNGRRCAEKCRLRHKECYKLNGNNSVCTQEFMQCYPTCFFRMSTTALTSDQASCSCPRSCMHQYDQCIFFSSKPEI